jgi:hypothetical protein
MSIQDKIDAFKKMIDDPYNSGKWDKDILALSLQGVSDEMIKKTIDKKKYLTSDFLKMKKFKIKLSYLKQRKKILFDRFKNEYLENEKQKEIREMNSLVWGKALYEGRIK